MGFTVEFEHFQRASGIFVVALHSVGFLRVSVPGDIQGASLFFSIRLLLFVSNVCYYSRNGSRGDHYAVRISFCSFSLPDLSRYTV